MDSFCVLCFTFIFVMLSCVFLAALWSPVGKNADLLTLLSVVFLSLFPYGVPGQVWYLIVSIPDLCLTHC